MLPASSIQHPANFKKTKPQIAKKQITNRKNLNIKLQSFLPSSIIQFPANSKFQNGISVLFVFCLSAKSNHSISLLTILNSKSQKGKSQIKNKKTSHFILPAPLTQHPANFKKNSPL
ncbi:MAG: hypothetical protein ACI9Y7_000009 [Dokdonia sp.]